MFAPLFSLASVTFFSVSMPATMTLEADKTDQALYHEMVQSWKRYERLVQELPVPRFSTPSDTIDFKECPGCGLVRITPQPQESESYSEEVYGFNPRYSFVLERKRGKNWFVKKVLINKIDGLVQYYFDEGKRTGLFALDRLFLNRLVNHPQFRIISFQQVPGSTDSLISLDFESPNPFDPANPKNFLAFQAGTIVFDRKKYWCPVAAVMRGFYPDNGTFEYRYEMKYQDGPRGLPLLVMAKQTGELTQPDGSIVSGRSTTCHLHWSAHGTIHQEHEFTLSAFGLPEPPGVTWERPTPWWLYGIVVGFALVILSGIVYKVVGRWRTQAAKPQPR